MASHVSLSSRSETSKIFPSSGAGIDDVDCTISLVCSKCSYEVKSKNEWKKAFFCIPSPTRKIISDVSALIKSGSDLAIMGPSGSGKSTLLNMVALVPSNGVVSGAVTVNGHPLSSNFFRQYCAYVPQDDHLCPFFTCRETLEYAVDFFVHDTAEVKRHRVDTLLSDLGLNECQQTKNGNQFIKGLSGGQKRRLSLAVALAKDPKILFLDEPTSGLDSFATAEIISVLNKIKRSKQIAVICTIHQPSTRVFNSFDSILLLSRGRVAYFGPTSGVIEYFNFQSEIPGDISTPEYLLELVNSDFGDQKKAQDVQNIIDAWHDKVVTPPATALPRILLPEVPFVHQLAVHFRRQTKLAYCDPTLYVCRVFIFFLAGIVFALVYIKARERKQEEVTDRMFLRVIGWMIAVPSCMGTIAVFSFSQELQSVRREIKDSMYSPLAYLISNTLLQLPAMVVLSLSPLLVGAYGIASFEPAGFGRMLLTFSLALWAFEAMAQALSTLCRNPIVGMLLYLLLWFTSFLFAGFFIVGEGIPWPLRTLLYVSPLRWAIASMVKAEFTWSTFEGADLVSRLGSPGFECRSLTQGSSLCFGRTGVQVLQTLSQTYTLFNPSYDTFAGDLACLAAIGLAWKLLFLTSFLLSTRDAPSPPRPATTTATVQATV